MCLETPKRYNMKKSKMSFRLSNGFYIPDKAFIFHNGNDKDFVRISASRPNGKKFPLYDKRFKKNVTKEEIENVPTDGYRITNMAEDGPIMMVTNGAYSFSIDVHNLYLIIKECGIGADGILNGKYVFGWKNEKPYLIPESVIGDTEPAVTIPESDCKECHVYADASAIDDRRFFCIGERAEFDFVAAMHSSSKLDIAINLNKRKCFYGFRQEGQQPVYEFPAPNIRSGMMVDTTYSESYEKISQNVHRLNDRVLHNLPTDASLENLKMNFVPERCKWLAEFRDKGGGAWIFNDGKDMLVKGITFGDSTHYVGVSIRGNILGITHKNQDAVDELPSNVRYVESDNRYLTDMLYRMYLNLDGRYISFAETGLQKILREFYRNID